MIRGSVAFAATALAQYPLALFGFADEKGEVIPFLDVQAAGKMLRWAEVKEWLTPNAHVFAVSHYGQPKLDPAAWRLELGGLVKKPRSLTLAELKRRPRRKMIAVLE